VFTFTGLFGLGETFMSPTMAPLVNSLADERVRGRANSLSGMANSLALSGRPRAPTQSPASEARLGLDPASARRQNGRARI
jgi:hypothetical protein